MKECSGFGQFLNDIAPFFLQAFCYVYRCGGIRRTRLGSDQFVNEAHLIEPNEHFLSVARAKGAQLFRGRSVNYYQLAVGARPSRVTIRDAKAMTKVIGILDEQNSQSDQAKVVQLISAPRSGHETRRESRLCAAAC